MRGVLQGCLCFCAAWVCSGRLPAWSCPPRPRQCHARDAKVACKTEGEVAMLESKMPLYNITG